MFYRGVISRIKVKENRLRYLTKVVINNRVSGYICTELGAGIKLVREISQFRKKMMPAGRLIGGCACKICCPGPLPKIYCPFCSAPTRTKHLLRRSRALLGSLAEGASHASGPNTNLILKAMGLVMGQDFVASVKLLLSEKIKKKGYLPFMKNIRTESVGACKKATSEDGLWHS